jgi:hypothetical protein
MARFAVLIYAADSAHTVDAVSPEQEEADRHAAELEAAGAMLVAYAFTPRDTAVSIRADGVTPGPFLDAPHAVAGVYVLEAPDLDTAIEIARTNPAVRAGGGVEVRPVHSGGVVREDAASGQA